MTDQHEEQRIVSVRFGLSSRDPLDSIQPLIIIVSTAARESDLLDFESNAPAFVSPQSFLTNANAKEIVGKALDDRDNQLKDVPLDSAGTHPEPAPATFTDAAEHFGRAVSTFLNAGCRIYVTLYDGLGEILEQVGKAMSPADDE